jgi:hypothetical protein
MGALRAGEVPPTAPGALAGDELEEMLRDNLARVNSSRSRPINVRDGIRRWLLTAVINTAPAVTNDPVHLGARAIST